MTVKAIGASLTFGGNTLSGDFLFDQGNGQTRIAAVNVSASVAGVTLSAGEGAFLVTANGIAGQATRHAQRRGRPGHRAGGRALLRVNTTGATLDETLTLGNRSIAIKFGEAREEHVRDLRLRPEPEHRRLRDHRGRRRDLAAASSPATA